ncbi:MAG: ATP-binding protein [Lachnospiraceae bacterium]
MKKKWVFIYIVGIILAIIGTGLAIGSITLSYMEQENQTQYKKQASLLKDDFENAHISTTEDAISFVDNKSKLFDIRITLIEKNGIVFYDSETKDTIRENHKGRPEIEDALKGKIGFARRYSSTVGKDYYYAALEVNQKGFSGIMRISIPYDQFRLIISDFTNAIAVTIMIATVLVSLYVSYFVKKMTDPIVKLTLSAEKIAAGDYNQEIQVKNKDEIGRLANTFNHMAKSLHINEEILKSKNEELNAILSSMASGVVALDYHYKILFCNSQLRDILGLKEEIIVGESLFSYYRSEKIISLMEQIRESDTISEDEIELYLNNEKRIVRVRGTALHQKEKKKMGLLLVFENITELKRVEQMKAEFVSNVTHELKTPLTSIRGFVETLQSGAINDPVFGRKFLNIIDIESQRLTRLIEDILMLSKIESAEESKKAENAVVGSENEMVDVREVAKEVMELLWSKKGKDIVLELDMPEQMTPYFCNRNYLREIILNLTDNAIKYTVKGKVSLYAREEDNHLIICVKDTGVGISKEHLPRLFERFYRVDKGRSRKQGGTGLGLSIVKHIVELYRGKITVESELGVGSVFTVRLPYMR